MDGSSSPQGINSGTDDILERLYRWLDFLPSILSPLLINLSSR